MLKFNGQPRIVRGRRIKNLNTSYVKVQLSPDNGNHGLVEHLNTSYVKVQ